MLIPLLRLLLTFTLPSEAAHETSHRACEIAVYLLVSPEATDDAITLVGETYSNLLCRGE